MNQFYLIIALMFLFASFAFNSFEDTLVHHYDISVYGELGHDSYWYPDWTRKYENLETLERKGFWIFAYPAFFYDGWHLIKVFRYLALFHVLWFLYISNYQRDKSFKRYFQLLGSFVILLTVTHCLFYNHLLLTK